MREQLGNAVEDLIFDQGLMLFPALSLAHYRQSVETTLGPIVKLVQNSKDNPALIRQFRSELEALASQYFADNHIRQHYLMSGARKNDIRKFSAKTPCACELTKDRQYH